MVVPCLVLGKQASSSFMCWILFLWQSSQGPILLCSPHPASSGQRELDLALWGGGEGYGWTWSSRRGWGEGGVDWFWSICSGEGTWPGPNLTVWEGRGHSPALACHTGLEFGDLEAGEAGLINYYRSSATKFLNLWGTPRAGYDGSATTFSPQAGGQTSLP